MTPDPSPAPDPDDAPLTPAEEEAHRRQGDRLERETLEGTQWPGGV